MWDSNQPCRSPPHGPCDSRICGDRLHDVSKEKERLRGHGFLIFPAQRSTKAALWVGVAV
jgi:hypothetical protein